MIGLADVLNPRVLTIAVVAVLFVRGVWSVMEGGRQTSPKNPKRDPQAATRRLTLADIQACKGCPKGTPNLHGFQPTQILISLNGEVYDVTASNHFYGEGGPYHLFAGCDATMALALVQLDSSLCNNWDWGSLSQSQRKVLADWILKFRSKYLFVGLLEEGGEQRLDLSEFGCPPYPEAEKESSEVRMDAAGVKATMAERHGGLLTNKINE